MSVSLVIYYVCIYNGIYYNFHGGDRFRMKPKTIAKLKFTDGTIIDAEDLDYEEKVAYIEFAIHLAAPILAKTIAGAVSQDKDKPVTTPNDNLHFDLPQNLTAKEAADFLRVSPGKIYEMTRIYNGKYFPHVKVGSKIIIPRNSFIEWINEGGIDGYRRKKENAALEYQKQKIKQKKGFT